MPDPEPDLIPLLACEDIEREHDFLVNVLGFESGGLERGPDGGVVHAEVRHAGRRIWLHPEQVRNGLAAPGPGASGHGGIVVRVVDVDPHYERARAAGATILSQPRDEDYGQREYGIRDPEGHTWWIATPFGWGAADPTRLVP